MRVQFPRVCYLSTYNGCSCVCVACMSKRIRILELIRSYFVCVVINRAYTAQIEDMLLLCVYIVLYTVCVQVIVFVCVFDLYHLRREMVALGIDGEGVRVGGLMCIGCTWRWSWPRGIHSCLSGQGEELARTS